MTYNSLATRAFKRSILHRHWRYNYLIKVIRHCRRAASVGELGEKSFAWLLLARERAIDIGCNFDDIQEALIDGFK